MHSLVKSFPGVTSCPAGRKLTGPLSALAIIVLGMAPLAAQGQPVYTYRISIAPHAPEVSVKGLVGELTTNYSVPDIELEKADRVVRFISAADIPYEELNMLATRNGQHLLGYVRVNNRDGSIEEEGVPPMPIHQDTGNEVADHARYEAAKANWIARHPKAYALITGR